MSYPYDYNPWDDNGAAAAQQQPGATNSSGMDYNAAMGYAVAGSTGTQMQANFQEPAQGVSDYSTTTTTTTQQQQQQEPQQEEKQASGEPGFVGRFVRKHVPAAAPLLDTLSNINLPFVDRLVQNVNKNLLMSKMFYFFFYSAFGSLFPLMGVYFKQQGMNPAQVGILTGVRPVIEIFSAPLWHSLADRFNKSKALLLFSLLSWIVFTYSLCHIRPPASGCIAFNDTDYVIYTPYSANDLSNYELEPSDQPLDSATGNELMDSRNFRESAGGGGSGSDESKGKSRRRRQLEEDEAGQRGLRWHQFVYNVETAAGDSYTSSPDNELDFDLDNDFEDNLLTGNRLVAAQQGSHWAPTDVMPAVSSYFGRGRENTGNLVDGPAAAAAALVAAADIELTKQPPLTHGSRYRRAAGSGRMRKTRKEESDGEAEPEERAESEADKGSGGAGEDDENVKKTTGAQKGEQEEQGQAGEGEQGQEEEEEVAQVNREGDSGQVEGATSESDNKKIHGGAKHNQPPSTQLPRSNTLEPLLATTGNNNNHLHHQEEDANAGTGANTVNKTKRIYKQRHKTPPTHIVGMSPITIQYAVNYNPEKHSQSVTPMFSTIVYKLDDIKEVFFLLLLLISLGEFFSAPALTIADSVTLSYLGDNTDLYGRQRMFGSLSWAITLLLVGMALDNATSIADHPCGPHLRERSYTVCFIIFSLLMACAFFTATQFRFGNSSPAKSQNGALQQQTTMLASTTADSSSTVVTTTTAGNIDELYAATQPRSIFNTAPPVNAPPPSAAQEREKKFEFLDNWKSAVFAQRTRELPQWLNVFCQFKNTLHLTYLFITWFLGCGVGLVFTFLFWHLQDVGGTPTLFGICSVINHISEILAYFFSLNFIKRFGHTRVLSVGLGCNAIRFLYVAFLTNPYYALPFELVQGITHSTCFAACCSYMSRASKAELKNSTQGVMQGLYHGIGRACGALLGGYMINKIGSRATFGIYGLLSGCVLAGFLQVRKRCALKEPEEAEVKGTDDEKAEAAAIGGLGAPQGVPSAIDYQW